MTNLILHNGKDNIRHSNCSLRRWFHLRGAIISNQIQSLIV